MRYLIVLIVAISLLAQMGLPASTGASNCYISVHGANGGFGTISIYSHVIDSTNGRDFTITKITMSEAANGTNGYTLYADIYVNTASQVGNAESSPCKVAVSSSHDFLWEGLNYVGPTDYNTQGVSLVVSTAPKTAPVIYQFVNGGATSGSCQISDVSTSHQFVFSRIINQNAQGMSITGVDFWKQYVSGQQRLWADFVVNPSSTFNPALSGIIHSCTLPVIPTYDNFKWRIWISGQSNFKHTQAEDFGGFDNGSPIVQQLVE